MSINLNGTLVPEITNGTGIGTNGSEVYNSGVLTVAGRNGNVTLTNADIGGLGNLATQNAPPAGIVLSNGTTIGIATLSGGLVYSGGTLSDQWSAGDVTTIGSDLTLSAGTLSLDTTFLENGSLSPRFFQVERQAAQHNQNYLPNSTFLYGYSLWEAQLTGLTINTGNNTTYLSYTGTTTTAQTYSSSNIEAAAVTGTGLINLSGWIYNATAGGPATISVSCYNSSGTLLGTIAESSVAAGSLWTYVSNNGTPLTGTTYVQVTLGFTGAASGTAIGFSQLKLEDRGIATNWSDEASAQISQSGSFPTLSVTGAATVGGAISSSAPSSIPLNFVSLSGTTITAADMNSYILFNSGATDYTLPSTVGLPVGSWLYIIPQIESNINPLSPTNNIYLLTNDSSTETIDTPYGTGTDFSFYDSSGLFIIYVGSGLWRACDGSYIAINALAGNYNATFSSVTANTITVESLGTLLVNGAATLSGGTYITGSLTIGSDLIVNGGSNSIGGSLTLDDVSITGGLSVSGASSFSLSAPVSISGNLTIDSPTTSITGQIDGVFSLYGQTGPTVAGGGTIENMVSPVSGDWYQNTSGGPLWVNITVDLAAGQNAFMYVAETPATSIVPVDMVQPSTAGYHSVKALVPNNCYWSITTNGTINPSGFPSFSYRVI